MPKDKNTKQNNKQKNKDKNHINPGEINGKIEIADMRERKDGPGGN